MNKEIKKKLKELKAGDILMIVFEDHTEMWRSPLEQAVNSQPLYLFSIGRVLAQTDTRICIWSAGQFHPTDSINPNYSKVSAGRCMNHFNWIVKSTIISVDKLVSEKE